MALPADGGGVDGGELPGEVTSFTESRGKNAWWPKQGALGVVGEAEVGVARGW